MLPCKPQFYFIKMGCKGVFITRTCLHDALLSLEVQVVKVPKRSYVSFFFNAYLRCTPQRKLTLRRHSLKPYVILYFKSLSDALLGQFAILMNSLLYPENTVLIHC